jgi:hypothetical protein
VTFSGAEAVVGNPKVGAADNSAVGSSPEVPANDHPYTACTEDGTEAPLDAEYYSLAVQLN